MSKIVCLLSTLALLGGCGESQYPPVEILHARMGFFDESRKGGFVQSTAIPLRGDQRYGWAIELRTNKETVSYIEHLNLAGPTTWGIKNPSIKYNIAPDRSGIVVHRESALRDGMIYGIWVISPDDPPGAGSFKIVIEGKVEHKFQFELKKQ
jgi:hypothetical protein